jgi:hypothetical protein
VNRKMKNKNPSIILLLILPLLIFSFAITSVSASPPEKGVSFVCPVLGGKAGDNGNSDMQPYVSPPGGFNTVIGPEINVPKHSTNQNGNGSPGGPFASPGEEDYSAIWWGPK